jgi:hypothetical protein
MTDAERQAAWAHAINEGMKTRFTHHGFNFSWGRPVSGFGTRFDPTPRNPNEYQTPTADPQLPVGTSCPDTLDIFRRFLAKHCPLLVYRFKAFTDNEKQMRMQGGVEDLVQAAFLCGAMYERTRSGMEKDRAGKRT